MQSPVRWGILWRFTSLESSSTAPQRDPLVIMAYLPDWVSKFWLFWVNNCLLEGGKYLWQYLHPFYCNAVSYSVLANINVLEKCFPPLFKIKLWRFAKIWHPGFLLKMREQNIIKSCFRTIFNSLGILNSLEQQNVLKFDYKEVATWFIGLKYKLGINMGAVCCFIMLI